MSGPLGSFSLRECRAEPRTTGFENDFCSFHFFMSSSLLDVLAPWHHLVAPPQQRVVALPTSSQIPRFLSRNSKGIGSHCIFQIFQLLFHQPHLLFRSHVVDSWVLLLLLLLLLLWSRVPAARSLRLSRCFHGGGILLKWRLRQTRNGWMGRGCPCWRHDTLLLLLLLLAPMAAAAGSVALQTLALPELNFNSLFQIGVWTDWQI
jgi:hypothetical protein